MSAGAPAGPADAAGKPGRLYVYSGGFLTGGRIRRILTLAGYDIRLGAPGPGDAVGVWGMSPTAPRGEAVARHLARPVVRIEDAFLRSVHTGREGAAPLGLLIDRLGVHFASATPSDLETLLARHPLDDTALLDRARTGMARLKALHLSKYNACDPDLPAPDPGYVLVIDQTRGDASIAAGGARASTFHEMLFVAQEEHPAARIVIRSHPESAAGGRAGHFTPADAGVRISICDAAISPHRLLEGAVAVYTVASQLGFEAILAGHRPRVFGQPFYAGWGLSEDENPVWRRQRKLTRAQLFAAAMILYPTWYDPCRDRLCSFEAALDQLEAEVRAFRDDRRGHVAVGMRLWKRGHLQRAFGRERRLRFSADPARAAALARSEGRGLLVWGAADLDLPRDLPLRHVEDGFLRSRGLGAALVPPLSLVADRRGIYYDPTHESDLEALIAGGPPLGGEARAERLVAALTGAGLSKYNLPAPPLPDLPEGRRILVPGQVEDDASLRQGGGEVRTNLALLERVRAANPGAVILWKPHPDVAAGLRPGAVAAEDARRLADVILPDGDPAPAIAAADEVWTMTSTLGFEALLRGKPVTCLGTPFYAGWGLTRDLGPVPARRRARPGLAALAHACLIAYPRYRDPATGLPCPPEIIVERLARGQVAPARRGLRLLSKLQGLMASQAWLWR